jgi:hypothetical protein
VTDHRKRTGFLSATALLLALGSSGCANPGLPFEIPWVSSASKQAPAPAPVEVCEIEKAVADTERAQLFRRAETERADNLSREIERLQADLKTAESALVEAESGLSGTHTRAGAISSLAVTRIQVERAASRAPWRSTEIAGAREKLAKAEGQVTQGHFGVAIFFVYRARRVADAVLEEAEVVMSSAHARLIMAERVNLRAGPSTDDRILSVLNEGTPVIPQTNEGDWMLVQVTGGPAGWVHRQLLGGLVSKSAPASPRP